MTNRESSERQSIWSVASGWLPIYFALFDALATIGVFYVVGYNVFGRSHPTVHQGNRILSISLYLMHKVSPNLITVLKILRPLSEMNAVRGRIALIPARDETFRGFLRHP